MEQFFKYSLEIDFSAICGIGGAAVVANLKNENVAKIEKMDINEKMISEKIVKGWRGDGIAEGENELEELVKKTEFITVEEIKERMKKKNLDFGFILEAEDVFILKLDKEWYLVSG